MRILKKNNNISLSVRGTNYLDKSNLRSGEEKQLLYVVQDNEWYITMHLFLKSFGKTKLL